MSKKKVIFKILRFFTALITAVLLLIPVLGAVIMYLNSPNPDTDRYEFNEGDGVRRRKDGAYYFEIRKGETSHSVGLRLERAGLIRSRYFWYLLGRFEKEFIKSGTYKLDMPLSQIAIYELFVSGRQTLHRVTIPEGVTLSKIARIYEYEDICSFDDFMEAAKNPEIISRYNIPARSMEGYLFPDTYFFPSDHNAEDVVITMADNFFNRIAVFYPQVNELTNRELFDKVIVASIVEREYRIPEEAALMASVFYNRLNIRMGLQSCATIEYIITEIMGLPHPGFITGADLEINNLYNTYKWAGLPPGPISAPGERSLKAAFYPEETDFFYFRLENPESGRHIFSRTNEEHSLARHLVTKPESR